MRYLPSRLVPIALYHHLGDIGRRSRSYMDPSLFERHLGYFEQSGRRVIDLASLVEEMRRGGGIPRRTLTITFDDGWRDNYERAFPLMRRHGFPATIFLVSGRIGLKDYLGWNEIREMRAGGIRFGAHTVNHPHLTELPDGEARREIGDCKKALEDGLGEEVPVFCYPYGFFDRRVRDLVEGAGYRGACCNAPGRLWPDGDIFALKRVTMTYRMKNLLAISSAISGYYVFFKELRAGNKEYIKNPKSPPPACARENVAGRQIPNPKSQNPSGKS